MKKIIDIAVNDLRVTFSDNSIWVNLVGIPVAFIVILGIFTAGDASEPSQIIIDAIDQDNSAISTQFLQELRAINAALVICPMDNNEDDRCGLGDEPLTVERSVTRVEEEQNLSASIEIPAGFADAVFSGEAFEIVFRSSADPTQPDPLRQTVEAALQRVGGASVASRVAVTAYDGEDEGGFQQTVYDNAAERWENPPSVVNFTTADSEASEGGASSGFNQSTPGMGSMYVMFTVLAGAVVLLKERREWTLQRLATMPISRSQIMGGKILARFLMGMIQFVVAFITGALLGANLGDDLLALLLVMVSFTLCVTALALLLANFVEREEQASSITTFVVLVAAPIGGAWWPLEVVPDFMQTLAFLSPIGWAMDAFNELMFYGGSLVDVMPSIAVLTAASIIFFGIGVSRFEYTD